VKKNGGQAAQALGRSRGGFSTKIHAGCVDEQTGVSLALTGGERNDMPGFALVFHQIPSEHALEHAIMDKGYDSNQIRETRQDEEINAVIPPKSNRKETIEYDKDIYKLREKVERFFNKLKQYRRIATRYDKLGSIFLAFIHIVASLLIIK
jgi:transposase